MKKAIEGKGLAPAIGPYSAGVEVGDMIFTSGQIAMQPHTGALELDSIERRRGIAASRRGAK